jgi:hypothetical protein
MSCIRLNLIDRERTVNGIVHGSIGDRVIAALSAQPETVHELVLALARFEKPIDGESMLAWFDSGENFESYDAGLVVVDLAGQVVMIDSTYSAPALMSDRRGAASFEAAVDASPFGGTASAESAEAIVEQQQQQTFLAPEEPITFEVGYHNGEVLTDVRIPYRIPEGWLFVGSVPEYEGVWNKRRAGRAKQIMSGWIDVRDILFGRPLSQFIASELHQAVDLEAANLFSEIHARWLTTAREDLRDRTPRDWLLAQKDFIDFDLWSRELQWSFTAECPPPLLPTSYAYRYAGFGTHEICLYYELIRFLLAESHQQARAGRLISIENEIERLEQIKHAWLEAPDPESHGKSPALMIEWERKRIPLVLTPKESIIDEDCPICQAVAADLETPMFWHLDGCNMDDQFEFSFCKTRAEWEAENQRMEELEREYRREKAGEKQEEFEPTAASFEPC